ncbi:alkaline shock response membrane anchor protein AmaP [Corynebacterium lizhenjunii]|uniref:Alkaline shock response membrane anchor protein AmaP n=1 Tax=Corynebacterium lizhenjunii TaxID=2709394 RepID=A0A7T0PA62_9CORY|nr:alkaline shock response membrane anchor protein AmaP [Corynebacterium lizhenjunii]QPK79543.1 alkaline shock response membrane anchor protein AmaP [Corynebacterium lizhenjunii]
MSKRLAGIQRVLFFLAGVILIVLGAWPLLLHFEVSWAQQLSDQLQNAIGPLDRQAVADADTQPWWQWAVGIAAVVLAGLGLWAIVANLKVRRINRVSSSASSDEGAIALQLAPLTATVANHIAAQPGINSASRRLAYDRGRPQLSFEIEASAETSWEQLQLLVAETETDLRTAFPQVEVDTVYRVHYARPAANPAASSKELPATAPANSPAAGLPAAPAVTPTV